MKGRLLIVLALVVLQACDAPWAGPALPAAGQWISFRTVSSEGPIAVKSGIFAANSISALEAAVATSGYTLKQACPPPCWRVFQGDQPGHLYVAVAIIEDRCDTTVKEGAAIAGRMLYFVHWISDRNGSRCDAAIAHQWRLLSVSRQNLPASGTLTVRLQLQGYYGSRTLESAVELS
jgi:hypothetical protein